MEKQCLFCGKRCDLEKDDKHPDRWQEAYLCKTSDRVGLPTFKEHLLSICDQRNDGWAMEVRVRLNDVRATHDLHVADG